MTGTECPTAARSAIGPANVMRILSRSRSYRLEALVSTMLLVLSSACSKSSDLHLAGCGRQPEIPSKCFNIKEYPAKVDTQGNLRPCHRTLRRIHNCIDEDDNAKLERESARKYHDWLEVERKERGDPTWEPWVYRDEPKSNICDPIFEKGTPAN